VGNGKKESPVLDGTPVIFDRWKVISKSITEQGFTSIRKELLWTMKWSKNT
ncbi:unnamed protein product, partial [marine sediment metagenome]